MDIKWFGVFSPYTKDIVNSNAPESAGIYLLVVKLKDGNWKIFYVGKASNLNERLLQHLSNEEPNICIRKKVEEKVCGFLYALVSKETDRDGIEKYLYDHYKTECNNNDPGGKPVVVNLP